MQGHPPHNVDGRLAGIPGELIQEIARAAVNYALTKKLRYEERQSYLPLPRIMLEGFAKEEDISFDESVGDSALIEMILDKKVPLQDLGERCEQLGIDISKF